MFCPSATTITAGTLAAVSALAIANSIPPAGATPLRFIVALDDEPPITEVGLSVTDVGVGVLTVSVAVRAAVSSAMALMVTAVSETTGVVVSEKVAVVVPAAKTNVSGTVAAELLLLMETVVPLAGAGPLKVIVPVDDAPRIVEIPAFSFLSRLAIDGRSEQIRITLGNNSSKLIEDFRVSAN